MSATVVRTAHSPESRRPNPLDRRRRGPQNALQSLDLDTGPGNPAHRDRYTTSTDTTR